MVKRGQSSHHKIAKCWVYKLKKADKLFFEKATLWSFSSSSAPMTFLTLLYFFHTAFFLTFWAIIQVKKLVSNYKQEDIPHHQLKRNCTECSLQLSFRIQTTLQIKVHVNHYFIFLLVLKELVPNIDLWVWLLWEEKHAFSLTLIDLCL